MGIRQDVADAHMIYWVGCSYGGKSIRRGERRSLFLGRKREREQRSFGRRKKKCDLVGFGKKTRILCFEIEREDDDEVFVAK